jgi:hypothetical protein
MPAACSSFTICLNSRTASPPGVAKRRSGAKKPSVL